jgi:hypothetical protein
MRGSANGGHHGGGLRPPRRLGARPAWRGRARRVHHHGAHEGMGGRRRRSTGAHDRCGRPGSAARAAGGPTRRRGRSQRRRRTAGLCWRVGPVRDAVLVNAAAALVAYDGAASTISWVPLVQLWVGRGVDRLRRGGADAVANGSPQPSPSNPIPRDRWIPRRGASGSTAALPVDR